VPRSLSPTCPLGRRALVRAPARRTTAFPWRKEQSRQRPARRLSFVPSASVRCPARSSRFSSSGLCRSLPRFLAGPGYPTDSLVRAL
jgi:hypothetical protein